MHITTTGFAPLSVHTVLIIALCCNVWQADIVVIITNSMVLPEALYKPFRGQENVLFSHVM